MSNIAIKAEDISKAYQLGEFSTGTLSRDIERWWAKLRGKEDIFLKIGEANDRTVKGGSDIVWSLKDINFEIKQGDAVGIIGRNGAGKSTLLKVLSRVTTPTSGSIKVKGRIASLLEVGTGFHPELTGRENIYLNGAILGMRKFEIDRHFDAIVDFSGVERYVDTPVKRYSSGMYVRLAFAVAAHLESEILIVDEVLAVGDAEFQKKCLGKLRDVSTGQGRTVLFVSHNIAAVSTLCNKGIVLKNGQVAFNGTISDGVDYYLNSSSQKNNASYINESPKETDILEVKIVNNQNKIAVTHYFSDDITMVFTVKFDKIYQDVLLGFTIKDQTERIVFSSNFDLGKVNINLGDNIFEVRIPGNTLVPNRYTPVIALHIPGKQVLSYLDHHVMFEIEETGTQFAQFAGVDYGCVFVDCDWKKL